MTQLTKIQEAVTQLSETERAQFAEWFRNYQTMIWDRAFEADVTSGRLDWLKAEALAEHSTGKTQQLP